MNGIGDLIRRDHLRLLRLLYRQEQFELGGQLIFGIKSVGEVDAADSAVGVDLNAEGFNIVRSISAAGKV